MSGTESDGSAALVLAIGLDDLTLGNLRAALLGTNLSLETTDHKGAVTRARAALDPVIALLEWTNDREDLQARLCAALRRAIRPGRCYILALGGLSEPALSRAMKGAADDVLVRPFGGEVVLRLRHAVRDMEAARRVVIPADALDEALHSASGGEVVVRAGDAVARIHVQEGGIVWADLSSTPATMAEVVRHAGVELDAAMTAAVTEECHQTHRHFMDVLVAWNVVDVERATEAVRAFIGGRVKLVLELPGAAAMFLPRQRSQSDRLRITLADIPTTASPTLPQTQFPTVVPGRSRALGDVSAIFQDAARIEGVVSVALLERATGQSLLLDGAPIDGAVAWSQIGLLAALGAEAEDVIASVGERCLVLRPLSVDPSLALFVVLRQSDTSLGLGRALIARAASRMPSMSGA